MSSYNLGGGGGLFDPQGEPYDDSPQQWVIRPYTDPQTNETYDIVDGYVIVMFEGAPALPTEDPLAYDSAETAPPPVGDPDFDLNDQNVVTLVTATGAEVVATWPGVKGLGLKLPQGITVEQAVGTWATTYQGIVRVDPDPVAQSHYDPNDPLYPSQYHLREKPYYVAGHQFGIDARTAWDLPVPWWNYAQVFVIDSGVDRDHPDLQQCLAYQGINETQSLSHVLWGTGFGRVWGNLRGVDANGYSVCPGMGHGTCVAGVIGASSNNTLGVAGVFSTRYNVQMIPIAMNGDVWADKSLHFDVITICNSFYDVGIMKGMWKPCRYERNTFTAYGPSVVNFSVGGYATMPDLKEILDKLAMYVVIVASAGNDNRPYPAYPARYTSPYYQYPCIAVAAFGPNGMKADFSNYGELVKMAAPGVGIWTTDFHGNEGFYGQGWPDNGNYGPPQGTSFAAPEVAGVVGYIRGAYPRVIPSDIRQQLMSCGAYPYDTQHLQYSNYLDFYSTLLHYYNLYH